MGRSLSVEYEPRTSRIEMGVSSVHGDCICVAYVAHACPLSRVYSEGPQNGPDGGRIIAMSMPNFGLWTMQYTNTNELPSSRMHLG